MPINFTNFVSASSIEDEDYLVGYKSIPAPGQERRWPWKDIQDSFVDNVTEPSANSGGGDGTFFIMGDGSLRYCGSNKNACGGMGDRIDLVVYPRTSAFNPPLGDTEKVVKLFAQVNVVFAVTNLGNLYGCGRNDQYQMGLGVTGNIGVFRRILKTASDSLDAATVLTPAGDKVVGVSTGTGGSDANLTLFAWTNQGKVWAWGYNGAALSRAGVGNTTANYITTPAQVTTGLPAADPVVQMSGGGNNTNMVHYARTLSGKVFAIGEAGTGAVGSGGVAAANDRKVFTAPLNLPAGYVATDIIVGGEANVLSAWVILNNGASLGEVWATGANNCRQVNPGSTTNPQTQMQRITSLSNITKLSVHADSAQTTIFALEGPIGAHTKVVGWGNTSFGQLGIGVANNTVVATPTIPTNQPYFTGGKTIKQLIVAGDNKAKATAILDSDGLVWVCGYPATGLVGNGDAIVPGNVITTFQRCLIDPKKGKVKQISCGGSGVSDGSGLPKAYFQAITTSGKIFAWGYDHPNVCQLGIDATPQKINSVPSTVVFI